MNVRSIQVSASGQELLQRSWYHRCGAMMFVNNEGFCILGESIGAVECTMVMWILFHPNLSTIYYVNVAPCSTMEPPQEGWCVAVDGSTPCPKFLCSVEAVTTAGEESSGRTAPWRARFPIVPSNMLEIEGSPVTRIVRKRKRRCVAVKMADLRTNTARGDAVDTGSNYRDERALQTAVASQTSRTRQICALESRIDIKLLTVKRRLIQQRIQEQRTRRRFAEEYPCEEWVQLLGGGLNDSNGRSTISCSPDALGASPAISVTVAVVQRNSAQHQSLSKLNGDLLQVSNSNDVMLRVRVHGWPVDNQLYPRERAVDPPPQRFLCVETQLLSTAQLVQLQCDVTQLFRSVGMLAPEGPDWADMSMGDCIGGYTHQTAATYRSRTDTDQRNTRAAARAVFLLHVEQYLQSLLQLAATMQLVLGDNITSDESAPVESQRNIHLFLGIIYTAFPALRQEPVLS